MPSRNRSAKACEPASLSPKDTAPLTDFSDIVHASRYTYVFAFAPAPGEARTIAQPQTPVQHPPNKALHIVAGRQRTAGPGTDRGKACPSSQNGTDTKKEPPDTAARSLNREATNRVDRSYSMSRRWTPPVMIVKA